MTRRSLDLLEVKLPCPEQWDAMDGDERARHCTKCGHDVENLSAMTEDDAGTWLARRSGNVCVRIDRDERGKMLFALGAAALLAACSTSSGAPADPDLRSPPPQTAPSAQAAASVPAPAASAPPRAVTRALGKPSTTVGCVCIPGDPLCSCL